jgi:hypothetical protein
MQARLRTWVDVEDYLGLSWVSFLFQRPPDFINCDMALSALPRPLDQSWNQERPCRAFLP